jgi:hypothetical protein
MLRKMLRTTGRKFIRSNEHDGYPLQDDKEKACRLEPNLSSREGMQTPLRQAQDLKQIHWKEPRENEDVSLCTVFGWRTKRLKYQEEAALFLTSCLLGRRKGW